MMLAPNASANGQRNVVEVKEEKEEDGNEREDDEKEREEERWIVGMGRMKRRRKHTLREMLKPRQTSNVLPRRLPHPNG
jgi:hypothetical protein